jgi:hypothetical protein
VLRHRQNIESRRTRCTGLKIRDKLITRGHSHRQGNARRVIANLNAADGVGLAPVLCDPQESLSEQF